MLYLTSFGFQYYLGFHSPFSLSTWLFWKEYFINILNNSVRDVVGVLHTMCRPLWEETPLKVFFFNISMLETLECDWICPNAVHKNAVHKMK